jgi:hypothetical protein
MRSSRMVRFMVESLSFRIQLIAVGAEVFVESRPFAS